MDYAQILCDFQSVASRALASAIEKSENDAGGAGDAGGAENAEKQRCVERFSSAVRALQKIEESFGGWAPEITPTRVWLGWGNHSGVLGVLTRCFNEPDEWSAEASLIYQRLMAAERVRALAKTSVA
jgi:hypothetical protein